MLTDTNIVLCRDVKFKKEGDRVSITEKNFSLPISYFHKIFSDLFPDESELMFLHDYDPKTDGKKIYQKAKRDGKIVEEGENL